MRDARRDWRRDRRVLRPGDAHAPDFDLRQGRYTEARAKATRLDLARARADVPIAASCFCRLQAF
jgi:hypothetical protein